MKLKGISIVFLTLLQIISLQAINEVPEIIEKMLEDSDGGVRDGAIGIIIGLIQNDKIASEKALEIAQKVLEDSDSGVRHGAILIIKNLTEKG